ncbi:MAG TPA: glycosyltransferase family 2 protein [Bacteroidia bacterium]|nr:glycosyltransferase family 2 protein [Bacteroidia bacterium]
MQISIVIPLKDEAESLPELYSWIIKVLDSNFTFEIIFVDDGSKDNSWEVIQDISSKDKRVKAIRFMRNYGKSAALQVGFQHATGDVVITMDADLQDSPEEIPDLYKLITENGYDLISGWKKIRYDNVLTKNIPSKIYNAVVRWFSGIPLHDFNCGLKAYRKKVVKSIEVYGEMHRFIPVIAKYAGFTKIGEKVVQHRPRKYGKSKFGWERFINGFLDLLTILFMSKFGKKPMHFFGTIGTIMFLIGFIASAYLGIDKLYRVYHHLPARLIVHRPSFYIALTTMILGTLLFVAGFLGEMINRNSTIRNNYLIEEKKNFDE